MNLASKGNLIARIRRGKSTRKQFVDSHLAKTIAHQLRATRDRLGWSQEDLAKEADMNQNAISRLESVSYGKPTITTLKRLAAALDVALIVRFVPFSELVDWVSETPRTINGLTTESLAVANFEIEEQSGVFDQPVKTERERRQGTSAIAMDCYSRPTGDEPTEGMTEDMPTFQGSTVNEAQISASLGLDRIFIQQQRHGATTNATAR